jgi:hypothetical protein
MSPWIRPTARTISWAPLIAVAACLAAFALLPAYDGVLPDSMTGIAAAAVAAAVVAGTYDPAAALLSASPTPVIVRLARRLLFLLPTGLGVWMLTVGGTLFGLLALTVVGLAVSVKAGVPLGAAVPLAWTALAWAAGLDWRLR